MFDGVEAARVSSLNVRDVVVEKLDHEKRGYAEVFRERSIQFLHYSKSS